MMQGDNLGWAVAMESVRGASQLLAGSISGAYILGSLGHGGFSVECSDVDVAFVLDGKVDDGLPSNLSESLREIVRESRTFKPNIDASRLIDRISVFHCSLADLREGVYSTASRWPLLDRVDFLTSGICVQGPDVRGAIQPPSQAETAQSAVEGFMRMSPPSSFDRTLRSSLASNDRRKLCKTILFPVRMAYTVQFGRVVSNIAAASWMADALGNDFPLTVCDWRSGDVSISEIPYAELMSQSYALHDDTIDFVCSNSPWAVDQLDRVGR